MRKVGWRWAAAAWLLTMAAIGLSIATCGGPDVGTHHDYCASGTAVPKVTSKVTLTDQDVEPMLHVHVGEAFTVNVFGGASAVAEPVVTRRGVVCQVTRSAPARHLAMVYLATHTGTTRLESSYTQTGGSGGIKATTYSAEIIGVAFFLRLALVRIWSAVLVQTKGWARSFQPSM